LVDSWIMIVFLGFWLMRLWSEFYYHTWYSYCSFVYWKSQCLFLAIFSLVIYWATEWILESQVIAARYSFVSMVKYIRRASRKIFLYPYDNHLTRQQLWRSI
jgi:hypothetical protein